MTLTTGIVCPVRDKCVQLRKKGAMAMRNPDRKCGFEQAGDVFPGPHGPGCPRRERIMQEGEDE